MSAPTEQNACRLRRALGREARAAEWERQAELLRERFEEQFWCEDLSTYALALDGEKKPCRVRTSNVGHCLFTGLVSEERAARVAETLLGPNSFSGWGVRTVAKGEARYNPMSYHNGSVWPHDNAIVAAGLARYGLHKYAERILSGLFDASLHFDLHRMPELFCGFERRPGTGPTLYPVACAPQSWAAAAVFSLVQSLLGLEIDAPRGVVEFRGGRLPETLQRLTINELRIGDATVDLLLTRHPHDVGLELLRREGEVAVSLVK